MSSNCPTNDTFIDTAFFCMTPEIKWMSCFVLGNVTLLLISTISMITVIHYNNVQKNRLTMQPYYWLIAYCIFFMLQTIISMVFVYDSKTAKLSYVLSVINCLKINCQNMVLMVQVYEWFCYWSMINF